MTLLEQYLKTVRLYLRKGLPEDDILAELEEHLRSKLEDEEACLGRQLTETEQQAILLKHGNPTIVAGRYGKPNPGFAFGWQLIGPELFPLYVKALLAVFAATVVVISLLTVIRARMWLSFFPRYFLPMFVQFVIITAAFIFTDAFQRRSRRASGRSHPQPHAIFPPHYLQPVPRWISVSGLMTFGVISLWWAAALEAPVLILGPASEFLRLTSAWHTFFWPVLAIMLLGMVQRAITFIRPNWNWLQPATRVVTNLGCLALLYPILSSAPYVVLAETAADMNRASAVAERFNDSLWLIMLFGFGSYWLFNFAMNLWLCLQHAGYRRRRTHRNNTA